MNLKQYPTKNRPNYWKEKRKNLILKLKDMKLFGPKKVEIRKSWSPFPETKEAVEVVESDIEDDDFNDLYVAPTIVPVLPKYYGKRGRKARAAALLRGESNQYSVPSGSLQPIIPAENGSGSRRSSKAVRDKEHYDQLNQLKINYERPNTEEKRVRFIDGDSLSVSLEDSMSLSSSVSRSSSIGSGSFVQIQTTMPGVSVRNGLPKSIINQKIEKIEVAKMFTADRDAIEERNKKMANLFVLQPHQISKKKGEAILTEL